MTTAELLMTQAEIDANPDKWHAHRRDGIGASEAAMLLDLAPDRIGGRFTLYHRKREGLETVDTAAMERGRWLEPYVAQEYGKAHPEVELHPGGLYRSAERPWMIATPDRIGVTWEGGRVHSANYRSMEPVQLKTSIPEDEFDQEAGRLPAYHRAQALWEMATTGAPRATVPVLFILKWEVIIFTVNRDRKAERDIGILIEAGEEMRWRLEHGKEPDPDATVACTDTLYRLHGITERSARVPIRLARQYRDAGRAEAQAKARRRLALNRMLARAGDANLIYAVDHEEGLPKNAYMVRVASRTESIRQAYTVEASDGPVRRTNPCGWAKG